MNTLHVQVKLEEGNNTVESIDRVIYRLSVCNLLHKTASDVKPDAEGVYACAYTCIYVCLYVWAYECINMYSVHIYLYIYI